ncbi:MAG: dihydrolipoamide acetyltransferase family protein [Burkholderiaceae bacterium]
MGEFVFRLPDVGEGLAEAELVQWQVAVGDTVTEDDVIAAVMTDKATVDIPSPVSGKVLWLGGEVGDVLAIGADLIRFEVHGPGNGSSARSAPPAPPASSARSAQTPPAVGQAEAQKSAGKAHVNAPTKSTAKPPLPSAQDPQMPRAARQRSAQTPAERPGKGKPPVRQTGKPLAAPSVRRRALDLGIDLRQVAGTGPAGRVTHEDLDQHLDSKQSTSPAATRQTAPNTSVTDIKLVGLRRRIAEKMVIAKSRIPHITYVEEVDMTKLEELRATLNETRSEQQARLTILPFLIRAMVRAVAEQPQVNAVFDDDAGVIHQHGGVHVGMATQTDAGLVVPVIRHAEILDVWACAAEIIRLSEQARDNGLSREELTSSTITITSLGPMGGIVTTPVINYPEVAIVGVNKMQIRPMWDGSQFVPRKMMNLSASFDHRVIDGWDAATFVQKIKSLLETPAMIFMNA